MRTPEESEANSTTAMTSIRHRPISGQINTEPHNKDLFTLISNTISLTFNNKITRHAKSQKKKKEDF